MKRFASLLLVCFSLSISIAQIPDKVIPKNAFAVLKIDGNGLYQVGNLAETSELPILKYMMKQMSRELSRDQRSVFEAVVGDSLNPILDLKQESLLYVSLGDSTIEFGGVMKLHDASRVGELVKGMLRGDTLVTGKNSLMTDHLGFAWNDDYLWFSAVKILEIYVPWWDREDRDYYSAEEATAVEEYYEDAPAETEEERLKRIEEEEEEERRRDEERERKYQERLKQRKIEWRNETIATLGLIQRNLDGFWSRSTSKSLLANSSYTKGDFVGGQMSARLYIPELSPRILLAMEEEVRLVFASVPDMLKGYSLGANLDFGDDQIKLRVETTIVDQFAADLKKANKARVSSSLKPYLGGKGIAMIGSGIDLKSILSIYENLDWDMAAGGNRYAKMVGPAIRMAVRFIDEDEISDMFDGGVVFNFMGVKRKAVTRTTYEYDDNYEYTEVEYTDTTYVPSGVAAIGFSSDKTYLDILEIVKGTGLLEMEKDYYRFDIPGEAPVYMKLNKDHLVVSLDVEYLNGVSGRDNADFLKTIKKNPTATNFDLVALADLLLGTTNREYKRRKFELLKSFAGVVPEVNSTVLKAKGNKIVQELVVEVKGRGNSLESLLRALNTLLGFDKRESYESEQADWEKTEPVYIEEEALEGYEEAAEEAVEEEAIEEEASEGIDEEGERAERAAREDHDEEEGE